MDKQSLWEELAYGFKKFIPLKWNNNITVSTVTAVKLCEIFDLSQG